MLTGQKGKGLENKGFFDSPYLPSQSPWGLSRVWSQKTDFYPFLRQSWAEMCCPRKPNLQFMLLLGLVAAAVSPHIQKPPQPKWKYPVWRGYTDLSLPPTSSWFCQHGNAHTPASLFGFPHASRKTCCNFPPLHFHSMWSQQQVPDTHPPSQTTQQLPPIMWALCSCVLYSNARWSYPAAFS